MGVALGPEIGSRVWFKLAERYFKSSYYGQRITELEIEFRKGVSKRKCSKKFLKEIHDIQD